MHFYKHLAWHAFTGTPRENPCAYSTVSLDKCKVHLESMHLHTEGRGDILHDEAIREGVCSEQKVDSPISQGLRMPVEGRILLLQGDYGKVDGAMTVRMRESGSSCASHVVLEK
jgi:hypothetical protein